MANKPLTYESAFLKSTKAQRGHIVERSRAQYNKAGDRLLRPKIEVEFTLEDYRAWVLSVFGSETGVARCAYHCGAWLTPATFSPDHIKPLARGGANRLDNLAACCPSCNEEKGELDGEWYVYLRRCLDQMPPGQAAMIHQRLQKSEKAAASVRLLRGRLARSTKPTTEVKDARP